MKYLVGEDLMTFEHIGVKGKSGRYPWGSGGRPYQRLEKKASKGLKKLEIIKKNTIKRYNKNRGNEQSSDKTKNVHDIETIIKDRNKKAADIKLKGEAIGNTRDKMKYMLKNSEYYSKTEIENVIYKHQAEESLKREISRSEPPSKFKKVIAKVDSISNTATKASEIAMKGAKAWNTTAKIYNSLNAGQPGFKPLTIIDLGDKKKNN